MPNTVTLECPSTLMFGRLPGRPWNPEGEEVDHFEDRTAQVRRRLQYHGGCLVDLGILREKRSTISKIGRRRCGDVCNTTVISMCKNTGKKPEEN
ncbi:hypothetical protein QE152_g38637 [Popillia japonica]|uniref:Uncharacterized protein n=1 Tax=Popillia japonica TaxID=7064 RepID=A0AAW1HW52_POPJA